MCVVVVGAGATGRELARRLMSRHDVVLLDPDGEALDRFEQSLKPKRDDAGDQRLRLTLVKGDGTSRLRLSKLFDEDQSCALIAACGSDEINLETARLGRELSFEPVLALQHDRALAQSYIEGNITALDRAQLLTDHVELSLEHQGAIVPTGIGLGRGELVEIRLVSTSPVLDRPLKDMAPDRWRVAAVFRSDELIVPTGETRLQVDDRVLLVGDPEALKGISEYIRLGTPQFPNPYGPNVVSVERNGVDTTLCSEARGLAEACEGALWARGLPGRGRRVSEENDDEPECETKSFGFGSFDDDRLIKRITGEHPGVVALSPFKRSLRARLMGQRGPDAWLCDRLEAPILFCRGTFPYRRILLPVSESRLSVEAAEVAIDITRQLKASLTAVNVDLPRYISGQSEEMIHFEVVPVKRLCQLYEVPLEYRHHVGNPVRLVLQEAKHHDLVVLARHRRRADTFFSPDVALRLARSAACSVLVVTVDPRK